MILVTKEKNKIKISGHSGYDNLGKDIVCASVSSIIYTTVNAVMNIDKSAICFIDDKDMEIKVLKNTEVVDKLIKSMLELLQDLSTQYPQNIKIVKGE